VVGTSGPDSVEAAMEMRDLSGESVRWTRLRIALADRRLMDGSGCFFKEDLDLNFV
jgi:hypothetical protein